MVRCPTAKSNRFFVINALRDVERKKKKNKAVEGRERECVCVGGAGSPPNGNDESEPYNSNHNENTEFARALKIPRTSTRSLLPYRSNLP